MSYGVGNCQAFEQVKKKLNQGSNSRGNEHTGNRPGYLRRVGIHAWEMWLLIKIVNPCITTVEYTGVPNDTKYSSTVIIFTLDMGL